MMVALVLFVTCLQEAIVGLGKLLLACCCHLLRGRMSHGRDLLGLDGKLIACEVSLLLRIATW